jgi:hypothetical protein
MLDDLRMMLGIEDTSQDDKLEWILEATKARLSLLLGGIEPPESMNHIITEVSVIRFNRIGSEGMSSQTVEGETVNFVSGDFDAYTDEIQAYLDSTSALAKKGGFKFI